MEACKLPLPFRLFPLSLQLDVSPVSPLEGSPKGEAPIGGPRRLSTRGTRADGDGGLMDVRRDRKSESGKERAESEAQLVIDFKDSM